MSSNSIAAQFLVSLPFFTGGAGAAEYFVAPSGADTNPGTETLPWRTIQKACSTVTAGSTVHVKEGVYNEKVRVNVSGNATAGHITIKAYQEDHVVVDGTGRSGDDIFYIENKSYVRIMGFEIRNNLNVNDGSGIRVVGAGKEIELLNNTIHNIRGQHAMGITIYGTSGTASISNLTIDGNVIHDCEPATSEALTLNGNVELFEVTNNTVFNVNNIAIDFIGGEGMCPVAAVDVARNGVCSRNTVYNARSVAEDGYAAGIYVDGGRDIVIENNNVTECDLGIEVGAENPGHVTERITVRSNVIYRNDKVGLIFGGYDSSVGRVQNCKFINNTLFENDVLRTGAGQIWIQYASNNLLLNNIAQANSSNIVLYSEAGNVNNTTDYNLFFTPGGSNNAIFVWRGTEAASLASYRAISGQEAHSIYANPAFTNAAARDFHLNATSPARNAGSPGYLLGLTEVDLDGGARLLEGRVDLGADEFSDGTTPAPVPEPEIDLPAAPAAQAPNIAPSVQMIRPSRPRSWVATALTASAGDSDGRVVRVDFYDGNRRLGSDYTAPYRIRKKLRSGVRRIEARAIDDRGSITRSSQVRVVVK